MLGFLAILLVAGVLLVAAKVVFALILLPLKIGLGALKLLLFLVIGIPALIFGCAVLGLALPFLIVGLALAILIAPFVLLVKAVH